MRFIYTTDLHGNIAKYEKILDIAVKSKINLIHLGADLLPKESPLDHVQHRFIEGFLQDYYRRCVDQGIKVLSFFGNDDLYTLKSSFRAYGDLLDETFYKQDGYEFTAYGYVQDYKFGLKTACKIDRPGWVCPDAYISAPIDPLISGWDRISDVRQYFLDKGTIEDDLRYLSVSSTSIVALHQPPIGLDLDVCYNNRRVGSKSVYSWIEHKQPLVVLSGHIHESFTCTGQWKGLIGKTTVIQPGQLKNLSYVVIEIDGSVKAKYHEVEM